VSWRVEGVGEMKRHPSPPCTRPMHILPTPVPLCRPPPPTPGSRLSWGIDTIRSTIQATWSSPRPAAPAASARSGTPPPPPDAAPDAAPWGVELPLFYEASDRTRFAYALFLLNKDIEQLLHAHGLSGSGPYQLLANLYVLLTAAESGLPHPHQGAQPPGGGGVARSQPLPPPAAPIKAAAAAPQAAPGSPGAGGPKITQPRAFDWGDMLVPGEEDGGHQHPLDELANGKGG
jgi:hypothetical protein